MDETTCSLIKSQKYQSISLNEKKRREKIYSSGNLAPLFKLTIFIWLNVVIYSES